MRLLLALLLASRAWGAIAFVNSSTTDGSSSASTIAAPAIAVSGGNLIVVMTSWFYSGSAFVVSSVSDTAGNAFAQGTSCQSIDGNLIAVDIWYAKNAIANATDTVNVTFTGSTTVRSIHVHQYSGADTTSPFEVCAKAETNPTVLITSGSFSPAAANNVNVAIGTQGFTSTNYWAAGVNYTLVGSSGSGVNSNSEYRLSSPSGAQTASISFDDGSAGGQMQISVASFKEAGAIATGIKHRSTQQ